MTFPDDCRYTKEHEWVRLEDDGTATIGITDYAQQELGDIVFVELEEGMEGDADAVFGTVEAVKTVSDLFLPVAGTVVAINDALDAAPETVNADPYGDGWLVKIEPRDAADLDALMDAAAYKHMIGADA
ncbi:MAG: glycine cleavage system protein GcvH [Rhodothermales bacterium]